MGDERRARAQRNAALSRRRAYDRGQRRRPTERRGAHVRPVRTPASPAGPRQHRAAEPDRPARVFDGGPQPRQADAPRGIRRRSRPTDSGPSARSPRSRQPEDDRRTETRGLAPAARHAAEARRHAREPDDGRDASASSSTGISASSGMPMTDSVRRRRDQDDRRQQQDLDGQPTIRPHTNSERPACCAHALDRARRHQHRERADRRAATVRPPGRLIHCMRAMRGQSGVTRIENLIVARHGQIWRSGQPDADLGELPTAPRAPSAAATAPPIDDDVAAGRWPSGPSSTLPNTDDDVAGGRSPGDRRSRTRRRRRLPARLR